jgi:hypothetical protein
LLLLVLLLLCMLPLAPPAPPPAARLDVALQAEFERQILKPVFHF